MVPKDKYRSREVVTLSYYIQTTGLKRSYVSFADPVPYKMSVFTLTNSAVAPENSEVHMITIFVEIERYEYRIDSNIMRSIIRLIKIGHLVQMVINFLQRADLITWQKHELVRSKRHKRRLVQHLQMTHSNRPPKNICSFY